MRIVQEKQLRARWKALRDKYRKLVAGEKYTASGRCANSIMANNWIHFKALGFLNTQLLPRKTESNFDGVTENSLKIVVDDINRPSTPRLDNKDHTNVQLEKPEKLYLLTDSEQSKSSLSSNMNIIYSKKRKHSVSPSSPLSGNRNKPLYIPKNRRPDWGKEIVELEKKKLALLEEKKNENTVKEDNDDLNFFQSLIPTIRDFTPLQKMRYRKRILEFTEEFLSENITVVDTDELKNY
ncbi:hypothetical protein V9T40_009285 [Parthenolecanium corni]|uniref:BESS domain-containing protein n=1 Tax=Parthenolecanium corni TaxID=536013 RepID=A0AAN9TZA3_9HEMI